LVAIILNLGVRVRPQFFGFANGWWRAAVHSLLTIAFIADLEELARVPQSRLAFEEGGANIHRVPILAVFEGATELLTGSIGDAWRERNKIVFIFGCPNEGSCVNFCSVGARHRTRP
jgi:hypothetical protein